MYPGHRAATTPEKAAADHVGTGELLSMTACSLDECSDDDCHGQLQGPLITVLPAVGPTHTERGDDMLTAMSSRACEVIRDLASPDLP